MKKSDVKKWVKALRSGEYQQGKESLCGEDEISGECDYCCLGVACDILTESDWIKLPHWASWSIGKHKEFVIPPAADSCGWGQTETTSFPSKETLKEMGLDLAYAQELAQLNDKGWSFKRIANKIEKDLL
tara:strand:- start:506 stop:895 length:390 start_codon:yes stop_codon:yes gene_type:complete